MRALRDSVNIMHFRRRGRNGISHFTNSNNDQRRNFAAYAACNQTRDVCFRMRMRLWLVPLPTVAVTWPVECIKVAIPVHIRLQQRQQERRELVVVYLRQCVHHAAAIQGERKWVGYAHQIWSVPSSTPSKYRTVAQSLNNGLVTLTTPFWGRDLGHLTLFKLSCLDWHLPGSIRLSLSEVRSFSRSGRRKGDAKFRKL